ncbi:MAG: NAD(P)/FAD-dependent oxidoreductase [Trueperaceae bacterium]
MSTRELDLIVIGAGMAGLGATRKAASAGKGVAIVDTLPYGGTCALRGCDPKKVLVGAADLVDWHRRSRGHGVTGEARIDWAELMAFKRTFTEPVPQRLEKNLDGLGVLTLHGPARFTSPTTLRVGEEEFAAERFLIATGAKPRQLGIPGEELLATSTDFLELEALPERILFIGGGYVSFEFAHIAARAGANAIIAHRGERPLEAFDPDLVRELVTASEEIGIRVRLHTEITAVERQVEHLVARTAAGEEFEADLVVHGAGRVPEIDLLDLETGEVAFDPERGVEVNEYLQSISNPRVYAAGDAADTAGWPLTPVAVHEGLTAVSNILKGNRKTPDYTGTPSVAFTLPTLARAGLAEEEASAQGLEFDVKQRDTSGWFTARRTREEHAASKVLIEKGSGRILGAHLLGMNAGETIGMFALAIRHGLTALDLKTSMLVHPAAASDIVYMV